jgi:Ca-activated chloride channel homolog
MKLRTVALLSLAGMLLSSATVYSFTPPTPQLATAAPDVTFQGTSTQQVDTSTFSVGSTLRVEGRVGHARMVQGSAGETFVLLEVRSDSKARAATPAPSHLALVIDKSGSMRGERLQNALNGATTAVDQLGDGDMVSVVAFDDRSSIVVPATEVNASSRERIKSEIRTIALGGDTCISCGIEDGLAELLRSSDKVDRMIVLSDGDATAGVRDMAGFRSISTRAREQGISVTTIGAGVTYNQKILGGIALESGGGHYFIENTASLARVFQTEAEKLRSTVATNTEASIELAEGVELDRVFDRTFERRGRRIVVPLGGFAQGDVQTVLLKVRVPAGKDGAAPVAGVSLAFRDLVKGEDGRCNGDLGVVITSDPRGGSDLDGVVSGRLQRSETATALLEANDLFAQGKIDLAQKRLAVQQEALAGAAESARRAAPKTRGLDVENDFKNQSGSLSGASSGLAKTSPKPAAAVRLNQEMANPFRR